ncbi:MAG: hypothetical protein J6U71_06260 [Bacteroidales bacterium]|jgi:hypothetical protein|nr:hypothetical protein [Bacteroidales bacterium]MBO7257053.1 hypothetical protein [Bacteroidales bacterium]MBO7284646.1 hypothetical protein [Bacteroidales bacterium]MBO7323168.1 hypothetical protein [Bacteroidales bacterium]MBQ5747536.1 hypothetical protein [Bacteroidales bacterium]
MKQCIHLKTIFTLLLLSFSATIFAQEQQEEKTPEEIATEEADRLEKLLKLEPHQTFFIDSVLQHDMRAMYDEMQLMKQSGTQEFIVYQRIKEKWGNRIDSSYMNILTEKQWLEYLRSTNRMTKEMRKKYKENYSKKK